MQLLGLLVPVPGSPQESASIQDCQFQQRPRHSCIPNAGEHSSHAGSPQIHDPVSEGMCEDVSG